MHYTSILTIVLCMITSVLSTKTISFACDSHLTTSCISTIPTISSAKTYTFTTNSSSAHGSHHSSTKKMPTLTTSTLSYTNSSIISSTVTVPTNTLPTSIIVATGTPTPPTMLPSTITSFTVVPPTAAPSSTLAPTTQSSAVRDGKVVGFSGLALVVLAVSALVLL